jgi:hypothetical protein
MFLFDHHGSNDRLRDGGDQVRRVRDQGEGVRCQLSVVSGQWETGGEIRGQVSVVRCQWSGVRVTS